METHFNRSPLLDRWSDDLLRYSNVWEDPSCLHLAAARLGHPKQILSIGSAGDNALSMLLLDPDRVVILDLSPSQIALTELKCRAIEHLHRTEFLTLLGYNEDSSNRLRLFSKLESFLSVRTREHWRKHSDQIETGLLHQGRLDNYFRKFRDTVIPMIWETQTFERMIQTHDLTEQLQCWQQGKTEILGPAVREFFSKTALSNDGRHPSQFAYVRQEDIGPIFLKGFSRLISSQLISENPFLYLFLTGRPLLDQNAIPTLKPDNFEILKARIGRVELICQDLESYLSTNRDRFDFMNLSDVFEYLSEDEAENLFRTIHRNLSDRGGIGYWTLLVDRKPQELLRINENVSSSLTRTDRTWFYSGFYLAEKFNSEA